MKKTNQQPINPDKSVLDFIAGMGQYVTFAMIAVIIASIVYFTSCKFTYEWRVLNKEFTSFWTVAFYSAAYCLITDGSRIALLLYGLRDFALSKNSSGYFGIFLSILLTGYAIYESSHIAESIAGSSTNRAYDFLYIGFIVTNILAIALEWRMVVSTKGLFAKVYNLNIDDDDSDEDEEIEYYKAPQVQKSNNINTPPPYQFSANMKSNLVPQ